MSAEALAKAVGRFTKTFIIDAKGLVKKISPRSETAARAMPAFAKATAGIAGVAQLVER